MGRNLFWLRRTLGLKVAGFDVNQDAISIGRDYFGFDEQTLWVAGADTLDLLPQASQDAVFTVSVLDHLPKVDGVLEDMLRIARKESS